MGHVGLTPQTSTALGGYRAQGRTAEAALKVAADALAILVGQQLGARLPERTVKIGASILFFVFAGVLLYEALA